MTKRKECPDCKRMFDWDDTPDGRKLFCKPCRQKYNRQHRARVQSSSSSGNSTIFQARKKTGTKTASNKPGHHRRQQDSIVRQTIDSPEWKRVKEMVIARDGPICQNHRRNGVTKAISGKQLQLDHIVPQEVRPDLIWDLDNLEHLCLSCHGRKTREESGMSAATRRLGLPPLVISWDLAENVWVASGHTPKRIAVFQEATGVQNVVPASLVPGTIEALGQLQPNTLVLATRESQFELGKQVKGRFIEFLEGFNL